MLMTSLSPTISLYDACCRRAESLAAVGQTAAAVKEIEAYVALHPQHAEAWNDIAVLQHAQKQLQPALLAAGIAVSLDPANPLYRHTHASVLLAAGQAEDAAQVLAPVLAADPRRVDALILAGDIKSVRDKIEDARFFWREALAVDPASTDAAERLASLPA